MANKIDLTNKIFGKLLVLRQGPTSFEGKNKAKVITWECQCSCGVIKNIKAYHLIRNQTSSCGCAQFSNKQKYDPKISSARKVYLNYKYLSSEMISFESFLKLSQLNCHYCGVEPNNHYNIFLTKKYKNSLQKQMGLFSYNGLDRIDSTKSHSLYNVVPCCLLCNKAKNNSTQEEFLNRINGFKIRTIPEVKELQLPKKSYLLTAINCSYKIYLNYDTTDLSMEEFYYLSQQPCHYCGLIKSNLANRIPRDYQTSEEKIQAGNYYYNGLDRLDSSLDHSRNNIVPCCKYCNFAKGKLSLKEFQTWMLRVIKFNQKT